MRAEFAEPDGEPLFYTKIPTMHKLPTKNQIFIFQPRHVHIILFENISKIINTPASRVDNHQLECCQKPAIFKKPALLTGTGPQIEPFILHQHYIINQSPYHLCLIPADPVVGATGVRLIVFRFS